MEEKLSSIFNFLKENRQYNHSVQENFYLSCITPFTTQEERVTNLLYHVANTQSQPKIKDLSEFFRKIYTESDKLNSFENFIKLLHGQEGITPNYDALYKGLKNHKGWGDKTAALFTKSIYHMHNQEYSSNLKIWNDAPKTLAKNDKLFLPVDAVIIEIFSKLENYSKRRDFVSINKLLIKELEYSNRDIEIWDDLWFWGFITQRGATTPRKLGWNEDKYWILKESSKDEVIIKEIKSKAKYFVKLL